jgi:hypothetical protein
MTHGLDERWRTAFLKTVQQHENAAALKEAALEGRLADWTSELTAVVVATCQTLGWHASAKNHRLDMLPIPGCEYLGMDVMAFDKGEKRWRFPIAVIELENSRSDDRIAYSLWKVLCVRAQLRIVFCYRRSPNEGAVLIRLLRDKIIQAMGLAERMNLEGKTIIVVGSRADSATFPYGFFKWWRLENNTGTFTQV